MPAGGQVGEIRVPVEQVKRRIFLVQQVIVDDIAPDQILPAQQVERRRHEAPVEIALALGKRRDKSQLIVIDKDLASAWVLETNMDREQGCRFHLWRLTDGRRGVE